MGEYYMVVEFADDGLLAVVPDNWFDNGRKSVLWPPYKDDSSRIRTAAKIKEIPMDNWKLYPVKRIMYQSTSWETVNKKCKEAELTSNLESEDQVVDANAPRLSKRRKRSPQRYDVDLSDTSSNEDNSSPPRKHRTARPTSQPIVSRSPPPAPSISRVNRSVTPLKPGENVTRSPRPSNISGTPTSAASGRRPDVATMEQTITRLLSPILTVMEQMRQQLEEQKQLMKTLIARQPQQLLEDEPSNEDIQLPCTTEQELVDLDRKLADKRFEKKMVNILGTVGGMGLKDVTRRICREVITNGLSLTYNPSGTKDKKPFNVFRSLNKTIHKAIRKNDLLKDATDKDIAVCISKWFTGAKDRDGGRTKRKEEHAATQD